MNSEGLYTVGQRLKHARTFKKVSARDLAKAVDIGVSTIYDLERGDQESSRKLGAIARALGISGLWLETGQGDMLAPEQTDLLQNKFDETYSTLNRVRGAALAGGGGAYAWEFEEVDHSHAFRREWLEEKGLRPHRCKLWGVTGDSMAPWACDGDVVMINMDQTQIRNGKVYAIAAGDELRIKRLFKRSDGSIEVRSDNPSPMYPTETYYGEDINNIKIIGEVVWRGG